MMVSGRVADKLIFAAIYTAVAVLVVGGARQLTNYALDAVFYRDYLMQWEVSLIALRQKQASWLAYDKQDPMAYMQHFVRRMQAEGLQAPQSNTAHAYVYRLHKFGEPARRILLVCLDNRIILYGLPASSFDRLDQFVDGQSDPAGGDFTGRWSSDRMTRIAQWHI
jgi:hypothetical protein